MQPRTQGGECPERRRPPLPIAGTVIHLMRLLCCVERGHSSDLSTSTLVRLWTRESPPNLLKVTLPSRKGGNISKETGLGKDKKKEKVGIGSDPISKIEARVGDLAPRRMLNKNNYLTDKSETLFNSLPPCPQHWRHNHFPKARYYWFNSRRHAGDADGRL